MAHSISGFMKYFLRDYFCTLWLFGSTAFEIQFKRVWCRFLWPRYWRTSYIFRLYFCADPNTTDRHKVVLTLTLWNGE